MLAKVQNFHKEPMNPPGVLTSINPKILLACLEAMVSLTCCGFTLLLVLGCYFSRCIACSPACASLNKCFDAKMDMLDQFKTRV